MPIKHVALKQLKKNAKRAARNQSRRSEFRALKKRFLALVDANKSEEARALLPEVVRQFAQAASKGVIHANVAARTTSRLTKRLSTKPSARPPASPSSARAGTASAPTAPTPPAATAPDRA